ncbi:E3 ubiquitin protein ligase MIEL1-like protein [Tanacetum coccineum]
MNVNKQSALTNPKERHEIVRHDIKQVICELCSTEQQAAQICTKCGVKMGEYFCDICKFYEDDISKEQFHCNECGICRIGGREKFFHCEKCGSCSDIKLVDNNAWCGKLNETTWLFVREFLFDSIKSAAIMKCGHTMHMECQEEMLKQHQYRCPICSKSVCDMATTWQRVDEEIEATAMPEEYRYEKEKKWKDKEGKLEAFLSKKFPPKIGRMGRKVHINYFIDQITFDFLELLSCATTATILAKQLFTFLATSAATVTLTIPEGLDQPTTQWRDRFKPQDILP